jgi:iron complex transport system substrate-binding protein
LYDIGLGDLLCGVTHECNFPPQALDKPKVIVPTIDFGALNAAQIDSKVRELSYHNYPIFRINEKLMQKIKPDLIISQDLCSVCAPYTRETKTAKEILGYEPENLILNPKNFTEVLKSIETIGKVIGNLENADKLINTIRCRLKEIESVIKSSEELDDSITAKQTVLFLDWINPFFLAGHWIPEMIEIAGGKSLNSKASSDSKRIAIRDLEYLDPDKIVISPCGFTLEKTRNEYERLCETKWNSLRAVRNNEIYLVNSDSYFSKPSPRLIKGIEILCKIINPNTFRDLQLPHDSLLHN